MSAKLSKFVNAGIGYPLLRALQARERIVTRNEAGELVTMDVAEIKKKVEAATGHKIAVGKNERLMTSAGKRLSVEEHLERLIADYLHLHYVPPKPTAKATLFWCACGKVEEFRRRDTQKKRCSECTVVARRAQQRARRAANREVVRAQARARNAANREVVRAQERARRAANREAYNAQQRAYYAAKKSGGSK